MSKPVDAAHRSAPFLFNVTPPMAAPSSSETKTALTVVPPQTAAADRAPRPYRFAEHHPFSWAIGTSMMTVGKYAGAHPLVATAVGWGTVVGFAQVAPHAPLPLVWTLIAGATVATINLVRDNRPARRAVGEGGRLMYNALVDDKERAERSNDEAMAQAVDAESTRLADKMFSAARWMGIAVPDEITDQAKSLGAS